MNTLKFEADLAAKYKYKKLERSKSEECKAFYRENTPNFLSFDGGGALCTMNGTQICHRYRRIVVGDYGAFVEFDLVDLDADLVIEAGQEWRLNIERYANVKYTWWTVPDGSHVKIYHQRKTVTYADYKPGLFYVSVHEVMPGAEQRS